MDFRSWLLSARHDFCILLDVRDQVALDRDFPTDITELQPLLAYVERTLLTEEALNAFEFAWGVYRESV